MPNSLLTGTRVPDPGYAADIAKIVQDAIEDIEGTTIPRFGDTAERDAAYAAWVAAGGVLEDGMHCAVGKDRYRRSGGTWKLDTNNGGTSGVLAGTAPPAGTPLTMKTYVGPIPTNASGDTQVVLPGGAYANGLVIAEVGILGFVPVDAKIREDCTVGVVKMRVYDLGSGAAVGALPALLGYVMAWGW